MTRLLTALLVTVLISAGLISLMAVLVLSPGPASRQVLPPPPEAIVLSRGMLSPAAHTDESPTDVPGPHLSARLQALPGIPVMALPPAPQATAMAGRAPLMPAPEVPRPPPPSVRITAPTTVAATEVAGEPAALAQPLSRIAPRYPSGARRASQEGFVRLGFSITPDGRVTAIEVLEAQPVGIFERAAIQALRRWRYAPYSSPLPLPRQSVKLVFELTGRQP